MVPRCLGSSGSSVVGFLGSSGERLGDGGWRSMGGAAGVLAEAAGDAIGGSWRNDTAVEIARV